MENKFLFLITSVSIFGLIIGSFLNVIICRYPIILKRSPHENFLNHPLNRTVEKINFLLPRSFCMHCRHAIPAKFNIPLFSFFWLQGKCNYCGLRISWQYPLVELLNAFAYFLAFQTYGISLAMFGALILSSLLIIIAFIDFHDQLIPDALTIPWLWLGLIFNIFHTYTSITNAIIGVLSGYLSLWLVNQGYKLIARQEGIGYGDFKLLAMLGAWLGWMFLPFIILISAGLGTVWGIILIIFKKNHRKTAIAYGPFLAVAGWITLLWGHSLVNGYLKIFNINF